MISKIITSLKRPEVLGALAATFWFGLVLGLYLTRVIVPKLTGSI